MRDVWEISIINSQSKERTGYPTQKPLALLKRVIEASSNEGDLVLDPFCGCATTCVAAQQLLCGSCNRIKGSCPMEYLRMKIKTSEEMLGNKIVFGE